MLFADPATVCGIATGTPGDILHFDIRSKEEADEPFSFRLARIRGRLEQVHTVTPLTLIGYESSRFHKSADASFCYGAIVGTILLFALDNNIEVESVPVATLKKFWTGSGNANKAQMIAAARQRGFEPTSDNEADALAGLHWMFAQFGPLEVPKPVVEGASYEEAAE